MSTRVLWCGLAASALMLLAMARWLDPAHGFGAHEALGWPACAFRLWSGLPCPACGLTTAFSALARAELTASLRAHPLGLPLFLTLLATPALALRLAARRVSVAELMHELALPRAAVVLALAALVSWLARLWAALG